MANVLQVIRPYYLKDVETWVFDDANKGLVQEPFVANVPEMIDDLVRDIPNAANGFMLLFAAVPFPGYQRKLSWVAEEAGGNWYRADEPPIEGWLCPALFRYFDTAPPEIYVQAKPLLKGE